MSHVQDSAQSHTTSGSNNTPSLTGTTAGNFLALTVGYAQQTNGNPPTVAGWQAAENPTAQSFLAGAAFCGAAIFYKENIAGGTDSPTVTPAAGSTGCAISCQIEEHSGIATSSSLDTAHTNNAAASGTSGDSGTTGSTTVPNTLVISALALADVAGASHAAWAITTPAATGYTSAGVHQDDTATGRPAEFSYKYVTSAGTQIASWASWGFSAAYQAVIAAFKLASQPAADQSATVAHLD